MSLIMEFLSSIALLFIQIAHGIDGFMRSKEGWSVDGTCWCSGTKLEGCRIWWIRALSEAFREAMGFVGLERFPVFRLPFWDSLCFGMWALEGFWVLWARALVVFRGSNQLSFT